MLITQGRIRVSLLRCTWRMEETILEFKTTENTTWEHRNHLSYLEACLQSSKFRDWFEDRVCPVPWGGGWRAGGQRCCFTPKIPFITVCLWSLTMDNLEVFFPFGVASAFLKCLKVHVPWAKPPAESPPCRIQATVLIIPNVQGRKVRHEEVWWFRMDAGLRLCFPLNLSWTLLKSP